MARKKKVKTAVDEKTVSLLGVDVDLGLPATVPAEVKINPLLIGFGVGMKF